MEGCSSQRDNKSPQLNTGGPARGGTSTPCAPGDCSGEGEAIRDPQSDPLGAQGVQGEAVAVVLEHCGSRCANPSPNCTAPAWAILSTCFRIYKA